MSQRLDPLDLRLVKDSCPARQHLRAGTVAASLAFVCLYPSVDCGRQHVQVAIHTKASSWPSCEVLQVPQQPRAGQLLNL